MAQLQPEPNIGAAARDGDWSSRFGEFVDYLTSEQFLAQAGKALVILFGAFLLTVILRRALDVLVKRARVPRLAMTPLQLILRYAIWLFAFILVVEVFGVEDFGDKIIPALGAILGLVAIGFVAVWSVLSNFLCTFVLVIFKPFSVGDELEVPADNIRGVVVDLSVLFTTLRTEDGADIQIPNNMFFQRIFKRRDGAKSVDLDTQLRRDTPIDPT